jgi:uncharacterized protein (DUF1330 family)
MAITQNNESRRSFLRSGASATAGFVLGSSLGCMQETEVQVVEINAVLPTAEQMQAFLALPDAPVVMLNLLKFKSNGGAEEYGRYFSGVRPLLEKTGAKILIAGEAATCLVGNADWDMIALVEYPSPAALSEMVSSDAYQAIHHHREAGLEGQVLYAILQTHAVA